jgi:putative addiction module component (TIGR02574 family)
MPIPFETLEAEVLRLSPAERSHLLDRVVASLDADASLDAAWDDEAARRDAETENGTSSPVPGRDVLARLRAQLG